MLPEAKNWLLEDKLGAERVLEIRENTAKSLLPRTKWLQKRRKKPMFALNAKSVAKALQNLSRVQKRLR